MSEFTLQSSMREIESRFPFSRQLLFKSFHLGGCASCGFEPDETLQDVAQKHQKNPEEVLDVLNKGFENQRSAYISASELGELQKSGADLLMVDVREDWEFEMSHIPQSVLLNPTNIEETFEKAKSTANVVVVCHHGLRAMNATLYMKECGIVNARCLKGGIDAYSVEVDPSIPRY